MIAYYPSEERYSANHGWLFTRHSFSFADYYDPSNIRFGTLRVLNDDLVQPEAGFGMHPHRDMEIISYIIEGTLEHRDSMGNTGRIQAGELQCMTAGTGIEHAEYNPSDREPVHFLQIWILPREKGLQPSWEQKKFSSEEQKNTLLPIVSGSNIPGTLHIHQDAVLYLSTLDDGITLTHNGTSFEKHFIFCVKGQVKVNNEVTLYEGDSARITDIHIFEFLSTGTSQFLLIEIN